MSVTAAGGVPLTRDERLEKFRMRPAYSAARIEEIIGMAESLDETARLRPLTDRLAERGGMQESPR